MESKRKLWRPLSDSYRISASSVPSFFSPSAFSKIWMLTRPPPAFSSYFSGSVSSTPSEVAKPVRSGREKLLPV